MIVIPHDVFYDFAKRFLVTCPYEGEKFSVYLYQYFAKIFLTCVPIYEKSKYFRPISMYIGQISFHASKYKSNIMTTT